MTPQSNLSCTGSLPQDQIIQCGCVGQLTKDITPLKVDWAYCIALEQNSYSHHCHTTPWRERCYPPAWVAGWRRPPTPAQTVDAAPSGASPRPYPDIYNTYSISDKAVIIGVQSNLQDRTLIYDTSHRDIKVGGCLKQLDSIAKSSHIRAFWKTIELHYQ